MRWRFEGGVNKRSGHGDPSVLLPQNSASAHILWLSGSRESRSDVTLKLQICASDCHDSKWWWERKKKKENSRCGCCRAGTWQRAVFISEGFAETALEWLGFLLFFHPQSDSPLLFISSYSCPSFHRAPPPSLLPPPLPLQFYWLRRHTCIRRRTPQFFIHILISCVDFLNILCSELASWQGFFKSWERLKGGGSWSHGEENRWVLPLSRPRTYWPLLFSFFNFFFPFSFFLTCPHSELTGKQTLGLPECSQCVQFPAPRARGWKTKTDRFWRKREVGGD